MALDVLPTPYVTSFDSRQRISSDKSPERLAGPHNLISHGTVAVYPEISGRGVKLANHLVVSRLRMCRAVPLLHLMYMDTFTFTITCIRRKICMMSLTDNINRED
jgi:hypothetical protein